MLSSNSLSRLLAFASIAGSYLVDASPIIVEEPGRAIPLTKRMEVPLADSEGVINWDAANAHLSRTFTKYDGHAQALHRRSAEDDLVKRDIEAENDYAIIEQEQLDGDVYDPLQEARAAFAFGLPEDAENQLLARHTTSTKAGNLNRRPTPTWVKPKVDPKEAAHKLARTTSSSVKKAAKTTAKPKTTSTVKPKTTSTAKPKTTSTTKLKTTAKTTAKPKTSSTAKGKVTSTAARATSTAASKPKTSPVVVSTSTPHLAPASSVSSASSSATQAVSTAAGNGLAAEQLQSYSRDLLWAGSLSIGTPAQQFVIDFDTGSADLWVPSVNCSTQACTSHHAYDDSKSSSSSAVPDSKLHIQYGDGSTTDGQVFKDVVTVAGMSAEQQTFGVAADLASNWNNDPMDGIMGMAYQSISQLQAPPFFQTLMSQSKVVAPQFSFALSRGDSGKPSELYLGGANADYYKGDIEWHSVASKSFWVVKGNANVNETAAVSNTYMIIDTGTTVVVAPPNDAKAFWSQVPGAGVYGQGYYTYPCDAPPSVSLNFGGQDWKMSEASFNLGKLSASSNRCVGSIVGQDVGMNAWIVGDKFLTNVYASFDFGKNAVGFAARK